jgi:hypothetical protein
MLRVLAIVGPIPDESPLVGLYIFDRTPAEAEEIMGGDPEVGLACSSSMFTRSSRSRGQ